MGVGYSGQCINTWQLQYNVLHKVSRVVAEASSSMNRGNFCLTGLSGKGTNWTEACSWWSSKQQAVELFLLRREWGAVLSFWLGTSRRDIFVRTATYMCWEEGGGNEFWDATDRTAARVYPLVKLSQEYPTSCFWCGLYLNWLLLPGASAGPEGTSDCMDWRSPLPSKTTYLQGTVLASCQPKWQDVPNFLFRHSMCPH